MNMEHKAERAHQRGSLSVEAALVFPLLFMGLLALIYISILYYQNVAASAAVMQAANRVAGSWNHLAAADPAPLAESEEAADLLQASDFRGHNPYRHLFDISAGKRLENGTAYAVRKLEAIADINANIGREDAVQVRKAGLWLAPYIEVELDRSYFNPLGRWMERVGIGGRQQAVVRSRSPLTSPTELIRTVSFAEELLRRMGENQ